MPARRQQLVVIALLDEATTELYRTGLFQLVRPRLSEAGEEVSDVLFDLKESLARAR